MDRDIRLQEKEELQPLKADLEVTVRLQDETEATVTIVPAKVQSFLVDFQRMDVKEAKVVAAIARGVPPNRVAKPL